MKGNISDMHEYYASNKNKFRKGLDQFLALVVPELEKLSGKKYNELCEEIWTYYEPQLLERFPYVGRDKVSGTKNLTGAYYFVAMGEVLKRYGASMDDIGHIMVYCYERHTRKLPGIARFVMGKFYKKPKLRNKALDGGVDYDDYVKEMKRYYYNLKCYIKKDFYYQ